MWSDIKLKTEDKISTYCYYSQIFIESCDCKICDLNNCQHLEAALKRCSSQKESCKASLLKSHFSIGVLL